MRVGRLLEIRADFGYRSVEDVDALFAQVDKLYTQRTDAAPVVIVADWRRCPLMSPEAATRVGQRIAQNNERTQRSAALASNDAPLAVLQFVRLIRDAGLPERKLFFNKTELIDWLSEVLTPREIERLREFLGG